MIDITTAIRVTQRELATRADPEKAAGMQAYMKTENAVLMGCRRPAAPR